MYQCIYIVRNIKEIFVFIESQNETTVKKNSIKHENEMQTCELKDVNSIWGTHDIKYHR